MKAPALLLVVPVLIGTLAVLALVSGLFAYKAATIGSDRLETDNWQTASSTMLKAQPDYVRKYAYYQVKPGQTVKEVADFFSVSADDIREMNPGQIIPGTTVKITPVEDKLRPRTSTNTIDDAVVTKDGDLLRILNEYELDAPIVTTIPELKAFLEDRYDAIDKTDDKTYRLNRALSIEGDIRVDVTDETVEKLDLVSTPDTFASLVFDESSVLFDGVSITSVDPSTDQPDTNSDDGRSFVRMKNGRMDVVDSTVSYLGNGLEETLSGKAKQATAQNEGGTYGISWRIDDDQLGQQITTGWVADSSFERNHFGAYTYGASGILWRDNRFFKNEVYGLDPHDDSNNSLIEGNVFESNGKHGFIVSKRCNYNIIRNNRSVDNKLHGFMLHQDSAYNLMEDNISYGNVDNFVVYESNFNTIRDNRSYTPKSSHIRVNDDATNTFITGNELFGGGRGVYLYGEAKGTYVAGNTLVGVKESIQTKGASYTFYGSNTEPTINYDIQDGDEVIFGENTIDRPGEPVIPDPTSVATTPDLER